MRSESRSTESAREQEAVELVCAIAHEIGNHLGAIRLQAHLLDEDLDARGLAEASVSIDGLAGRAAPLLALIRPILSPERVDRDARPWSEVLGAVRSTLEDAGTGGVRVEISPPAEAGLASRGGEWMVPLVLSLLESTIEHLAAGARVAVRLERRGGDCLLVVEDDGEEEDLSAGAPCRGRALAVQVADLMTRRLGGGIEVVRGAGTTRVGLAVPAGASGPPVRGL